MFSPQGEINFSYFAVKAAVIVLTKHSTEEDWTSNLPSFTHIKDILENSC